MVRFTTLLVTATASLAVAGCASPTPAPAPAPAGPTLTAVFRANTVWNGVTVSDDGRAFVCFPRNDGGIGVRIAEAKSDGSLVAYPDLAWNSYKAGSDPAQTFVGANALRFGPDGLLWVVDDGTVGSGTKIVPGGPKLVVMDTKANHVVRTIPLDAVAKPDSFIDDIRFNGPVAYITDAGAPALIVLDLKTGQGRRVLENDPSTTDRRPIRAQGQVLHKMDGGDAHLHADQLEVSPDGQTFYFQPASGPMYKLATRDLDDPTLAPAELAKRVQLFYDTPSTGGTAIDAAGNIYVSDVDHQRVLKLTPDGTATTLIQDTRLLWGDAMWIDKAGFLWIPAAQLDRTAPMQQGFDRVHFPVVIYKAQINAKPLRN